MSLKLNFLELHDPEIDLKPFSWICFDVNECNKDTINYIIQKVLTNFKGKTKLIQYLANRLKCSYATIEKNVNFRKNWFPIPLYIELLRFYSKNKAIKYASKINKNIKFLKISGPTAKPIKFLNKLSIELCETAGACAADGTLPLKINIIFKKYPQLTIVKTLQKKFRKSAKVHYDNSIKRYLICICTKKNLVCEIKSIVKQDKNIERLKINYFLRFSEEKRKPLEIIANNIYKDFGIKYKPSKIPKVNAYYLTIGNKIIIRYLIKFMGLEHGKKTYSIRLPKILYDKPERYKDAFMRGLMQFDGSVELAGNVSIQQTSQKMMNDLSKYLNNKHINHNFSNKPDKKGLFTIKIHKNQNLSFLFFPETLKYYMLRGSFDYQPQSIKEGINVLNKISNLNIKIKLGEFLNYLKPTARTIYDLQAATGISRTSLQNYLYLLLKMNIVQREKIGKAYIYNLNNEYKQWKLPKLE